MSEKRTEIKELGEFGLINRIKSNFSIKPEIYRLDL